MKLSQVEKRNRIQWQAIITTQWTFPVLVRIEEFVNLSCIMILSASVAHRHASSAY